MGAAPGLISARTIPWWGIVTSTQGRLAMPAPSGGQARSDVWAGGGRAVL